MGYIVRLTQGECLVCEQAAKEAFGYIKKIKAVDRTVGKDGIGKLRLGAGGEFAMCRLLGVSWKPWTAHTYATRKFGDAMNIEVRSTAYNNPMLILNQRDLDKLHRAFVLMQANLDMTQYEFVGWVRGREGMAVAEDREFGNGEKSYVVKQKHFRDPYELLERFAIWAEEKSV